MRKLFISVFILTVVLLTLAQCKKQNKEISTPEVIEIELDKIALCENEVNFTNLGKFVTDMEEFTRQGVAIYGDYLIQAHHPARYSIFDIPSKKMIKSGMLQPETKTNHANNICFSNSFIEESDQFPLLYISENHTNNISVNRISSLDSEPILVQTITLPGKIGHYINAVFDFDNKFIYTICFRDKNWNTDENGNHLVVSKLALPDVSEGDVIVEDIVEQFPIPFRRATQGAFFTNGLIVHGFGNNTNGDDALLVIDPSEKKVLREINTHDIFQDEIEGVHPYDNSILVTLQKGDVYSIDFK